MAGTLKEAAWEKSAPERNEMIVIDFSGEHSVQSVAELEQRLAVRFNDEENGFILAPDSSEFPQLLIQVKGRFSVIHYFRDDDHAGYESLGGKMNLDPDETTTFSLHRSGGGFMC